MSDYGEVLCLVGTEVKHGETPEQKLNRLFREALPSWRPRLVNGVSRIGAENSSVTTAEWPMERLYAMPHRHARASPRNQAAPIIVVAHRGSHMLVDGANRINRWWIEQREGSHPVLLLTVQ